MSIQQLDNVYWDGSHFDCINQRFTIDIPFYVNQIKKYGQPVLELACGTGRLTLPLAAQHIDITGIDCSEPMLSQAREKAQSQGIVVPLLQHDIRSFKLERQFNLIFIPFNSFLHLHSLSDVESCLACVRNHLTESGHFIVDIFNPSLQILTRDTNTRFPVTQYIHPHIGSLVTVDENNVYDTITQINHIIWYFHYEESGIVKEFSVPLDLRMFFPEEINALLKYNGFSIVAKYGAFDETPFNEKPAHQLIVCKRA